MESSRTLSKIFNIIFPFSDFLYLLQQEEYSLQRIWFWLPRFFFKRNFQKRDHLLYTLRSKMTLVLAILLFMLLNLVIFSYIKFNIFLFILLSICIPIIILISNLLISPISNIIKKSIIRKAKYKFQNIRGRTIVITVTGSYGKTTLKNFLEQFLKYSYKVQMIPGNINSTIGIANWILNNFKEGVDILIVEADSYKPKGIANTAKLVKTDIAIITNVGDQHLQRYKTKENLAHSLAELFEFSGNKTIKITNTETLEILKKIRFNTNNITIIDKLSLESNSPSYNESIEYAILVASILKIPNEYIDHISKNLILPDRRQSLKEIVGFSGIDDSYNISFTTACAGINEAFNQSKKENKRLLVITAGIPELGPMEQEKNKELGYILSQKAEKIFVLKSIFAKEIISGIDSKEKLNIFNNYQEAMQDLKKNHNTQEWFVLLQPELTDIYY